MSDGRCPSPRRAPGILVGEADTFKLRITDSSEFSFCAFEFLPLRGGGRRSPGAVDHFLAQLLGMLHVLTGRWLERKSGLGTGMFAGTEAASSAGGLETLLPLLPQPLDAPAMPAMKDSQTHSK